MTVSTVLDPRFKYKCFRLSDTIEAVKCTLKENESLELPTTNVSTEESDEPASSQNSTIRVFFRDTPRGWSICRCITQVMKCISTFLKDVSKTRNGLENGLANGLERTTLKMLFAIENQLNRRNRR